MERLKKVMECMGTRMFVKFLATYLLPVLLSVAQLLIEGSGNSALLVIIITGVPTTISYILAAYVGYFYASDSTLDPFYLSSILLFIIFELVMFIIYLLLDYNLVIGCVLLFLSITLYFLGYKIFNGKGD